MCNAVLGTTTEDDSDQFRDAAVAEVFLSAVEGSPGTRGIVQRKPRPAEHRTKFCLLPLGIKERKRQTRELGAQPNRELNRIGSTTPSKWLSRFPGFKTKPYSGILTSSLVTGP